MVGRKKKSKHRIKKKRKKKRKTNEKNKHMSTTGKKKQGKWNRENMLPGIDSNAEKSKRIIFHSRVWQPTLPTYSLPDAESENLTQK